MFEFKVRRRIKEFEEKEFEETKYMECYVADAYYIKPFSIFSYFNKIIKYERNV